MKNPREGDNRFHHFIIGVVELSHFRDMHKVAKRQLVKGLAVEAKYREHVKN